MFGPGPNLRLVGTIHCQTYLAHELTNSESKSAIVKHILDKSAVGKSKATNSSNSRFNLAHQQS